MMFIKVENNEECIFSPVVSDLVVVEREKGTATFFFVVIFLTIGRLLYNFRITVFI